MSLEHEDAMQEMRDGKCVWKITGNLDLMHSSFRIKHETQCDNNIFSMKCDFKKFNFCPFCGREIEVSR